MLWHEVLPVRLGAVSRVADQEPALQLEPSSSWRDIADPDWTTKYASKFWLVDLNGDGRDDLVIPGKTGLSVGYSNGTRGFSRLEPLIAATNLDYRALRFADVNKDGLPDLVAWIQGVGLRLHPTTGRGFNAPLAASQDFSIAAGFGGARYLSTMQTEAVNGDGCADV